MIATETSRAVVERFMRGDLSVLADDATIWLAARVPVPPSTATDGGVVTKGELAAMMGALGELGRTPYRIEIVGITAENGRVAVEAVGHIELAAGGTYDNRYHILFEVAGDRIVHMREYSDTRLVFERFGRG